MKRFTRERGESTAKVFEGCEGILDQGMEAFEEIMGSHLARAGDLGTAC
jgi:hypothetical protein